MSYQKDTDLWLKVGDQLTNKTAVNLQGILSITDSHGKFRQPTDMEVAKMDAFLADQCVLYVYGQLNFGDVTDISKMTKVFKMPARPIATNILKDDGSTQYPSQRLRDERFYLNINKETKYSFSINPLDVTAGRADELKGVTLTAALQHIFFVEATSLLRRD